MMRGETRLRDAFSERNPFVCLFFYVAVLGISAVILHPVVLGVSFAGWFLVIACRKGFRFAGLRLLRMMPFALLTALLNPMFSHEGITVLTYLPSGNPLTKESLFYGMAAGMMMLNTLGWFLNLSEMMTGEKWIYLFGRTIPALSLVLSMVFRFVPRLLRQIRKTHDALAQSETGNTGIRGKQMLGLHTFSAVVSWALENAAETADSMHSRGYGLPSRTVYSRYGFELQDGFLLLLIGFLFGMTVYFRPQWRYFPSFYMENSPVCILCFGILCGLPSVLGFLTAFRYGIRIRRLSR